MRSVGIGGLVLAALWITGCGATPEQPSIPFEPPPSLLGDAIQTSLSDLAKKPRSELASMCSEWLTKIDLQTKAVDEGRLHFTLLPCARASRLTCTWSSPAAATR